MIDLTPVFQKAKSNKGVWDFDASEALADQLSPVFPNTESIGGPNDNWYTVVIDRLPSAYIYRLYPIAFIRPELFGAAKDLLENVEVVTFTDENEDLYSFDKSKAQELLTYSLEMLDLDLNGFALGDFIYETA